MTELNLRYQPEMPREKQPIVIIGAGGIVNDAHLPAYRLAGFEVRGICDIAPEKAHATAAKFGIDNAFASIEELVDASPASAVYDLAVMARHTPAALELLPDGSAVLIQKPLGESLAQAEQIRDICRRKKLAAAVNFQLRFAPFVLAAGDLIDRGLLGDIYDLEVRVCVQTPWQLFPFLNGHPRVEILYHSVHYIDLIRSFLGDPVRVYAKTVRHPAKPMSSTRTILILDYGDAVRAGVNTNHDHDFGPLQQQSFIKWEGTRGAAQAKLGLLMDYPRGVPDLFEYCLLKPSQPTQWIAPKIEGSWFPHGFIGSMASLQRFVEGSETALPTGVDDAIRTMAVVEAAYESSARGGVVPRAPHHP